MRKIFITLLFSFLFLFTFSQTKGTLTVKFTTSTYGGQYSPNHVLAVWITNNTSSSSTTFIKTMYATSLSGERKYLNYWKQATSTFNTTDATTGSTLKSHGSVSGSWNATNTLAATVPDGTYYVWIEFTEASSTGKLATYSFTKGGTTTSTPTSITTSPNITGFTLSWVPSNTAVEEVPAGKNYKIYPNPVSDYLNVTGSAFQKANVYNSVGKLIYTTDVNKINFSKYPKGAYVVEIVSGDGTFYRKAIKR